MKGKCMSQQKKLITQVLSVAYLSMLCVPHDSTTRLRMQKVLAALRDEIALVSGRDPQEVQEHFEATITRVQEKQR